MYKKIIANAATQKRKKKDGLYLEDHHILPRCLGGTNHKNNRVLLTAKEHYIAHHLLWKMYPGNEKIANAFWIFLHPQLNQHRNMSPKITSKEYERVKNMMSGVSQKLGKASHKNKTGMFSLNPEEMRVVRQKAGESAKKNQSGIFSMSQAARTKLGRQSQNNRVGIHSFSAEQLAANGKKGSTKGHDTQRKESIGIFGMSTKEKSQNGKIGGVVAGEKTKQRSKEEWEASLAKQGLPLEYRPNKEEAKRLGLKWYWGPPCKFCPELEGKRLTSIGTCTGSRFHPTSVR